MKKTSKQNQLQSILNGLPDPVFILSESGEYLAVYGGSDERFYHDGASLVNLSLFDIMDSSTAKWFHSQIAIALNRENIHIAEYPLGSFSFDDGILDKVKGPSNELYFEGRIRALPELYDGKRAVLWAARNITNRRALELKLRELSEKDELTGLYNRRKLTNEISKSLAKTKTTPSLIMFDIDYMKQINDKYGHNVGDNVLCELAKASQKVIEENDILARIGGDEFIILLKNTDKNKACDVANKLIHTIKQVDFSQCGCGVNPTISIGVTLAKSTDKNIEDLLKRVDAALYKAKNNGRNQIFIL